MNLKNIIQFFIRLVLFSPLYIVFSIPLVKSFDVDIINYYNNYINQNHSYDFLFEVVSDFSYNILHFSFEEYWSLLLIIQIVLLTLIYDRLLLLFVAYPTILSFSQFFFGTSVRYSTAVLFFILMFKLKSNILKVVISGLYHKGTLFISLLSVYLLHRSNKDSENIDVWFSLSRNTIFLIILLSIVSYPLSYIVLKLASYTSFYYYSIEGSHYANSKSIASILYIYLSVLMLLYSFQIVKKNCVNSDYLSIFRVSIAILYLCVLFTSISVLSGRIFLVYNLLEPFLACRLLKLNKTYYLGCIIIFFSFFKFYHYGIYQLL